MGTLRTLTDGSFEELVLRSEGTVLVDFWAEWCGPCRRLHPVLEDLQRTYRDQVSIFTLNIDENPETAAACGITGLPTMNLYRDGALVKQLSGPRTRAALDADLAALVG
ncbi:thioredoxin [Spirillospora sp. CA-294931]|uniref:thioredoxin n=1 Tax=Spirillospora sp. CA-294931 TaxID=3240042 RepID=UPI003D8FA82E